MTTPFPHDQDLRLLLCLLALCGYKQDGGSTDDSQSVVTHGAVVATSQPLESPEPENLARPRKTRKAAKRRKARSASVLPSGHPGNPPENVDVALPTENTNTSPIATTTPRLGANDHPGVQQGTERSLDFGGHVVLAVPNQSPRSESIYSQDIDGGPGILTNASHFIMQNPVVCHTLNVHAHERTISPPSTTESPSATKPLSAMELVTAIEHFEKHAIRGAEFDSSDRDPPPRCHPGTRKTIVENSRRWFRDTQRRKRILWFVGSAGVGKSAIMQTLAEYVAESDDLTLGATLFFSRPNGRNDPSKVFITLSLQIALVCAPYREFIVREVVSNPRLPSKLMNVQFSRLIVEPFVRQKIYQGFGDLLFFLDGLDECEGNHAQCEIIELISSFSLSYPDAPLTWVIASRPEYHLQAVFSRENITPSYDREEVPIDSDEACADVEKYLRKEFERIHRDDPIARLHVQWPTEREFLTISAAAAGLFAYASIAIKFIDDPVFGNPVTGVALLLAVIEKVGLRLTKGRTHPLAYLDALYMAILAQISKGLFPDTHILLTNHLALQKGPQISKSKSLMFLCNWVGMTSHDAYAAFRQLHSVLTIPSPENAEKAPLSFHHQSFYEYLMDPGRSHGFHISAGDMDNQEVECSLRVLKDAHLGEVPGKGDISKIVLAWTTPRKAIFQRALYNRAAWSITGIIDRFDPKLVVQKLRDPDVEELTKSLNFIDPRIGDRTYMTDIPFLHYIHHRLDPGIRTEFERLKLLQEIEAEDLNLDTTASARMYTRYESTRVRVIVPGASETLDGPFPIDYPSEYQSWWCTPPHRPKSSRRNQVCRDLMFVKEHVPDRGIPVFGNVTRAYLLFEDVASNFRWQNYVEYPLVT